MASGPNTIGSVNVNIVANTATLTPGLQAAQTQATTAGANIAAAFTQAAAPAAALNATITQTNTVLGANAAAARAAGTAAASNTTQQQGQAAATAQAAQAAAAAAAALHAQAAAAQHAAVTGQQAVSAFIRVGEGSSALRAVENFLAKTLGLGPAMQAIFPIVGGIAFLEILFHIAEKIEELYNKSATAGERIRGEWNELNLTSRTANDSLQVTNDKLDNQIAKLTGQHQNTLKLMLDEAKESADKLADALNKDGKALFEFLKKNEPGFFSRLFGTAGTKDITESQGGKTGFGGANLEAAKISEQGRQALERVLPGANAIKEKNAIIVDINDRIAGVYDEQVRLRTKELNDAKAELERRKSASQQLGSINLTGAGGTNVRPTPGTKDTEIRIEALNATIADLQNRKQKSQLTTEIEPKKEIVQGLQVGKEEFEKWLHQQEQQIELQKSMGQLSSQAEINAYDKLIDVLKAKGPAYLSELTSLQIKTNQLADRYAKERGDASEKRVKDQEQQFDKILKLAEEQATAEGRMPHTAALQTAQARVQQGPGLEPGSYQKALEEIPRLTQEAAKESEEILRHWMKTSQEIFEEGGERTAAEVSKNAAQMIATLQALGGMEDEIAAQQRRKRGADKQVSAQSLKVGGMDIAGGAERSETGIQAKRLSEQYAFESQITTSLEQQISHKRILAGLDEQQLTIKRDAAEAEFSLATEAGNVEKAEQAALAWLREDDQIRLHRLSTEQQIALMRQKESFGGRVSSGLSQDLNQAGQSLAQSFGNAVANDGKIGQIFRNSLRNLEGAAITTILGAAFKSAVAASGLNTVFDKVGGFLMHSPQLAATAANTAALVANTAIMGGDTAVTATHAGIMTSHLGVMVAHTGTMISHLAAMVANTIATVWNTIVMAVKSIFGFAGGGNPNPDEPFIAGEKGPELIHPKGRALTVVPADKTREIMSQAALMTAQDLSFNAPGIPASQFSGGAGLGAGGNSSNSVVTNQNTGTIGSLHVHLSGVQNVDNLMRQISDRAKRMGARFSPNNLGPQTA